MALLNEKGQKISYLADKIKAANTSYHRNRMTEHLCTDLISSFTLRM